MFKQYPTISKGAAQDNQGLQNCKLVGISDELSHQFLILLIVFLAPVKSLQLLLISLIHIAYFFCDALE